MIRRLLICRSNSFDPYQNLALEEALLQRVGEGELILYLWQNERTVVIGRNQNPWKECRTSLLFQEGGHLARRLSGGGAVFHDLGNMNFTFLMSAQDYDLAKQLTVLERACQSLGIPAQRSGRNDLLADGRKFSGNAFYKHAGKAYHHGTLMVDVDMEMVQRYLSPSKAKLAAKGVDSVRSRVVNLREFIPTLTIDQLADALTESLIDVYTAGAVIGRPLEAPSSRSCHSERSEESVSPLFVQTITPDEYNLTQLIAKYRSDSWLYGPKLPFTLLVEDRFSWGGVELQFQIESGVIQKTKVYTDAMDETLSDALENILTGCVFRMDALTNALQQANILPQQKNDLLSLLQKVL